jgi:NAD(P)-dependent dehydrogenase (short-subunit alcohol dehydrogenase family)
MSASDARRVAFITGAASGIGRATAQVFVQNGYAVALVDRTVDAGREAEAQISQYGECAFIPCEVTDDSAVQSAVAQTVERFGRLDAAFNAAGIDGELGKLTADGTMENWNRVIAIDLTGVWSCMRYQIPAMLKSGGGAIVNCSSVAGLVGAATCSAYVAAKHGVVGLTKTAAVEYARQGIRVNAVCPGMIDTPMTQAGLNAEILEPLLAESPIGRFAQPTEVSTAVLWLCDPGTSFVTGQALAVDGGWTSR